MKRVNVLISTYNGETYLQEQVESIINQTYSNIYIYIRDDGSFDGTAKILDQLQKKYGEKLTYWLGENLGFGKSFLDILKEAEEGGYWAFCDQDDVWLPNKIEWAVEWMEKQTNHSIPLMFHSAFQNTDEQLNPRESYLPPSYSYDFVRSITDCLHMGFSAVINGTLRNMMLMGDETVLTTHDHWAELLVMEFGRVEFDSRIASLHRRLDCSLSEGTMKNRLKWLRGAFKGDSEILPSARECERVFGERMNTKDRRILNWFVYDRYHLTKSLKKAFYPRRWRPGISSEIVLRLLMLLGKV